MLTIRPLFRRKTLLLAQAAMAGMLVLAAAPNATQAQGKNTPAAAKNAEKPAPEASLATSPEVKKIEAYLNDLKTLKARFVQTDNNGKRMTGNFLLKRPGRMRFEYDPPATDFIVADGIFVHYYDGQMKQQSSAPIGQSLANFFLRENIRFDRDLRIENVGRDTAHRLNVTLTQAKDPLAGSITLSFYETDGGDLSFAGWRVFDPQGMTTDIALEQVVSGIKLDNEQFHYYNPQQKTPKYN